MTERQKRVRVAVKAAIPQAAADAFKEALPLRDHRESQLADDKHCQGVGLCQTCDEYEPCSNAQEWEARCGRQAALEDRTAIRPRSGSRTQVIRLNGCIFKINGPLELP